MTRNATPATDASLGQSARQHFRRRAGKIQARPVCEPTMSGFPALHLRHHRRSQGSDAHPRQPPGRSGSGIQLGRTSVPTMRCSVCCPSFTCSRRWRTFCCHWSKARAWFIWRRLNTTECLRALNERQITTFAVVPQFFYLIHERIFKEVAKRGEVARMGAEGPDDGSIAACARLG